MRNSVLGFVGGVMWLQWQAQLASRLSLALLGAASVLLFIWATKGHSPWRVVACRLIAGCAFGFAWGGWFAQAALSPSLPAAWEGRDMTLVGTIDSLPDVFAQGVRFHFLVEQAVSAQGEAVPVPPRIALSWYAQLRDGVAQEVGQVQPGARWQLTVRLQRPHGNANPYGFDYEVWLLEQHLRATGYVRTASTNRELTAFVIRFSSIVDYCRAILRTRILQALPDHPYAGVIVALVVGDQRTVSQSDWKVFNRAGIGHLISISGLHITMVAGLFAALAAFLWRRSFFTSAQLPLRLPAQKVAALVGALTAFLYVLLAGFGVPAQRTLYMLCVVALALWRGQMRRVSDVLCAALGVVVLLDPWAVLWPGFWLSFGAVATILYASIGRTVRVSVAAPSRCQRCLMPLREGAHLQYVITLGLVPLSLLLFAQLSLISPIANALAIPLVSFLVTPLALIGSILPLPLAKLVLGLAHLLIAWLAEFLQWLSSLPHAVWRSPVPPLWVFISASIGTLWLLAPRGWPQRWLGLPAMLPLILQVPSHPLPGQLWVTAFDVGQGMALLVETAQHRLLYDTGPAYSTESDGASRVVLPYLQARGIDTLDGLIVSHNDNDHSGGALSLLADFRPLWTASSLAAWSPIVQAAPAHRRCVAGQHWQWDGVRFDMLHPDAQSYADASLKPNARSCTLKISAGSDAILLAGDIEAAQERALIASAADLRSTVLLAPHHGSGTSSSREFLQAVDPQIALFQVGYRNRYHHPKAEILERYAELGIRRIRTDEAGAVSFVFGHGQTVGLREYRLSDARYWRATQRKVANEDIE